MFFFTGKVDFFKGLTNGCMTDTENGSHFFLRQPWICFDKLAKSQSSEHYDLFNRSVSADNHQFLTTFLTIFVWF